MTLHPEEHPPDRRQILCLWHWPAAILRDKTVNDNYYILTLAAIAMELRYRAFRQRVQ